MLGTIEILALIIIVVAAIKIIVILIKPRAWGNVVKTFYSKPILMMIFSLILALVVLNYLVIEGISIVQIFAVMLFVALLGAIGVAVYSKDVLPVAQKMLKERHFLRKAWLPILIWIILIIWAVSVIF